MTSDRVAVLDTSAVLAIFNQEPGAETIVRIVRQSAISTVNLAEIATKLNQWAVPPEQIMRWVDGLEVEIVAFTEDQAIAVGSLRNLTHERGLSLGDRACLALAQRLGIPAYTSDRKWSEIEIGINVVQFR